MIAIVDILFRGGIIHVGVAAECRFYQKVKKWPKKHHRELASMLAHLKTIHEALCLGAAVEHLRFGFVHPEPMGILALDQKGGGSGLKETRLYIFPHTEKKHLYAITIGDKASQSDDITYCKDLVAQVLAGTQTTTG